MKKFPVFFGLVILAIGALPGCSNRGYEESRYLLKAQKTGELMVSQAYACVSQSKAYQAVWEYAKVSEMDFKTAAKEMLGPQTNQNKATMVEHKAMIEELLSELSEPPSKFEGIHTRLQEIYEIYGQLHDLAMDPLDDMDKHMKTVGELSDRMAEKARELDAALITK